MAAASASGDNPAARASALERGTSRNRPSRSSARTRRISRTQNAHSSS
jgi:hypothetical protein